VSRVGEVWTLRRGDDLLGRVTVDDVDMFWLSGDWVPTPAFAEVAPLFAEEDRLSEEDDDGHAFDACWRRIWRLGVRLHDPEGREVPEFWCHVSGERAAFRWSDEPFPEGGIADAMARDD
jgi:hypothetical protein